MSRRSARRKQSRTVEDSSSNPETSEDDDFQDVHHESDDDDFCEIPSKMKRHRQHAKDSSAEVETKDWISQSSRKVKRSSPEDNFEAELLRAIELSKKESQNQTMEGDVANVAEAQDAQEALGVESGPDQVTDPRYNNVSGSEAVELKKARVSSGSSSSEESEEESEEMPQGSSIEPEVESEASSASDFVPSAEEKESSESEGSDFVGEESEDDFKPASKKKSAKAKPSPKPLKKKTASILSKKPPALSVKPQKQQTVAGTAGKENTKKVVPIVRAPSTKKPPQVMASLSATGNCIKAAQIPAVTKAPIKSTPNPTLLVSKLAGRPKPLQNNPLLTNGPRLRIGLSKNTKIKPLHPSFLATNNNKV